MINTRRSSMMKQALKVSVIPGLTLAFSASAAAQCTVPCSLVWSDEFSGTTLDLAKWSYQYGDGTGYGITGWGNNELQYYTDTQATVAGGQLTIRAEEVSPQVGGRDYISSRIRSIYKHDTAYGRYEVRAKLPANQGASGQGTWPAVWLLNSDPNSYLNWPASGEIDIMEWLGNNPTRIFGTLHYGNSGSGSANNTSDYFLPAGTTNDFHVYAVEWEETEIRWYVDGILYHTVQSSSVGGNPNGKWFTNGSSNPNAPFDTPFHWIMNVAVGGNFPGNPNGNSVFPQDLIVDYVRHYELSTVAVIDETPSVPTFVFENFEDNNPFDWNVFSGGSGGGGIGNNESDTPPGGGNWAMDVGWGGSGTGFWGGFQKTMFGNLDQMAKFTFWINPDGFDSQSGTTNLNQDYTLEINIQDDDTGDGEWRNFEDDEFQFSCRVSPTGPCAIVGGGWQKIEVPIQDFIHDTSFAFGGTGVLDTGVGSNGVLHNMTVAVISNNGSTINFDTDEWVFEGAGDPCVPSQFGTGCTTDTDGDGEPDSVEGEFNDTDGDGTPDYLESSITDQDGDGTPDELDLVDVDPCVPDPESSACFAPMATVPIQAPFVVLGGLIMLLLGTAVRKRAQ